MIHCGKNVISLSKKPIIPVRTLFFWRGVVFTGGQTNAKVKVAK
jgi:hypothetical protein